MFFTTSDDKTAVPARRWWIAGAVAVVFGLGAWIGWSEMMANPTLEQNLGGAPKTWDAGARPLPAHAGRLEPLASGPAPGIADSSPGLSEPHPASSQEVVGGAHPEPASPGPAPSPPVRQNHALAPVTIPEHERVKLQQRAQRIESRAILELDRLTPALGLSAVQQDQVFDVLVRRSPEFDPLMVTVGSGGAPITPEPAAPATKPKSEAVPAGADPPAQGAPRPATAQASETAGPASAESPRTTQDEILDVLTPDQAVRYVESEADRAAWWSEVLAHIDSATGMPDPEPGYGGTSGGPTGGPGQAASNHPIPSSGSYGGQ